MTEARRLREEKASEALRRTGDLKTGRSVAGCWRLLYAHCGRSHVTPRQAVHDPKPTPVPRISTAAVQRTAVVRCSPPGSRCCAVHKNSYPRDHAALPTWPPTHRDAAPLSTPVVAPSKPSSTVSSRNTWRPTSRSRAKGTGTASGYRRPWSGNSAAISGVRILILAWGFCRARCPACGQDFLVAFSCKGRVLCPSCNARRTAETAAHLVDHVFPPVPVRQWVLSMPKRLRWYLEREPKAVSAVLHIVLRVIEGYLCQASGATSAPARLGAVSFIHRFGASLNRHIHYHCCIIDGVFERVDNAVGVCEAVHFRPAPALAPGHRRHLRAGTCAGVAMVRPQRPDRQR